MAQVESPFNPEYERKHEETYDFRGADAPNAQRGFTPYESSNDIANAINIFNAGVTARDELTKKRIYDETVEQVDAVRDPWTGQDASPEGIRSGSTPTDLRKQFARLKGMDAAYKSGKTSDRHYWAQMENIARSIRARYPGYREHIDNVISDITGGTPANVLQRSINDEADKDESTKYLPGGSATRQLWKEAGTGENAIDAPAGYEEMDWDQSFKYINNKQGVRANSRRQIEDLENRVRAGQATSTLAGKVRFEQFWTTFGQENEAGVKAFNKELDAAIASGKPLSPEKVQALQQQNLEVKRQALQRYDNMVNERPDLYAMMSPTDIENQRKVISGYFDSIAESVGGPLNLAKANAQKLEMMIDQKGVQIVESVPTALDAAGWTKILGQNGSGAYFSSPNASGKGTMQDTFNQQMLAARKKELFDMSKPSNSTPVVAAVDKLANADETVSSPAQKSENIKNVIESNINALTSPETSLEGKERAAENWFGEGNADFLSVFNNKSSNNPMKDTGMTKVSLYQALNSPKVAQTMVELRTTSPKGEELYQNYQEWRNYNFYALLKSEIDTMKTIPVSDQTMNIQFDATTGKIITQDRMGDPNAPTGSALGWARKNTMSWINGSNAAVRRYNGMIDALTPTWKLEGKDPGVEAQALLQNAGGIDYNAEKETSFADRFANAVGEFIAGDNTEAGKANDEEFAKAAGANRNRSSGTPAEAQRLFNGPSFELSGDEPEGFQNIISFLRDKPYTPGPRESTNVEDRRKNDPTKDWALELQLLLSSFLTPTLAEQQAAQEDLE